MIEIIVIIAGIAVCIMTPFEVAKIQKGWMRKNFKGTQEQFVAAYRKQLMFMIWIGGFLGLAYVGLGIIEERAGENIVKFVIAAIWLAVGAISYVSREKLKVVPPPAANAP